MSDILREPTVSSDVDVVVAATYFIWLDSNRDEPDVTQLKLQKLLYLAQANYLASTGLRLVDSQTEAFSNGPVFDAVRHAFKDFGRRIIAVEQNQAARPDLPEDVEHFLEQVWHTYKNFSASELWDLSHQQDPWVDHHAENSWHALIPDHAMMTYFRTKVAPEDRIVHPGIVALDNALLKQLDDEEEEKVATALAALT